MFPAGSPYFDDLSLFDGLDCASIFGIDEIVTSSVEVEGWNIIQKDWVGNSLRLSYGLGRMGMREW